LDWATAFVTFAISWLRVAEIFSSFVGSSRGNLLHEAQLAGFMGQLGQKRRFTQVTGNRKLLHRLLNKGQIGSALRGSAIRHDLFQFVIGDHVLFSRGEIGNP
jgi:hypothetical protein